MGAQVAIRSATPCWKPPMGTPVFEAEKTTYRLDDDRRNGYYFSPYSPSDFEKITEDKQMPADRATTVQALWFDPENVRLSKTYRTTWPKNAT